MLEMMVSVSTVGGVGGGSGQGDEGILRMVGAT